MLMPVLQSIFVQRIDYSQNTAMLYIVIDDLHQIASVDGVSFIKHLVTMLMDMYYVNLLSTHTTLV